MTGKILSCNSYSFNFFFAFTQNQKVKIWRNVFILLLAAFSLIFLSPHTWLTILITLFNPVSLTKNTYICILKITYTLIAALVHHTDTTMIYWYNYKRSECIGHIRVVLVGWMKVWSDFYFHQRFQHRHTGLATLNLAMCKLSHNFTDLVLLYFLPMKRHVGEY